MMSYLANFLSNSWMVFLLLNFILLVIFLLFNLNNIKKQLSGISRETWVILIIIFLAGFALRNEFYFFGTHTDGYSFIEPSKTILETGNYFYRCDAGEIGNCLSYSKHTSPPGASFLISLVFLGLGSINSYYALALSGLLSSFSIILVFMVAYLAFKKEKLALYSALIYSFIPQAIIWSGTGHMRPYGLFFVLISLMSYLVALKSGGKKTWLFVIFSTSFAAYILKMFSILPLFYSVIYLAKKGKSKALKLIRKINDYLPFLGVLFLMCLPLLKWYLVYEPTMVYPDPKFSLQYLVPRGLGILSLLFGKLNYSLGPFHTFYIPIISFFVFGYFLFFRKDRKTEYFLFGGLFSFLLFVYSIYHVHGFNSMNQHFSLQPFRIFIPKDFVRQVVSLQPFYAILAGFSFYKLEKSLEKWDNWIRYVMPLVLFIFIFSSGNFRPSGTLFEDRRASGPLYEDTYKLVNRTPNNAFIISGQHLIVQSDVFPDNRRKALDVWRYDGLKEEADKLLQENMNRTYLLTQSCQNERFENICQNLKRNYSLNTVSERGRMKLYKVEA